MLEKWRLSGIQRVLVKRATCIIFNPAAKGSKAERLRGRIERLPGDVVVRQTSAPGDAEALAERAVEQGYEVVVAAGGDGTVNEVVNGIAGSDVSLGVLPVGTINVFALELGIPMDLRKAWEVIRRGHVRRIDLARANDHHWVQLAGVGFDAQIVEETDREVRKNFGPLSYLLTAALVAGRKPPRLTVRAARQKPIEGCFVLVGNGRYYGGPYEIFKGGRLDDGMLDVYVFQRMSHFDMIRYIQGMMFLAHDRMPDVKTLRARRVTVESPDRVPVEVDGELLGYTPVTFSVQRGKLGVLAPEVH